MAQLTDVEKEKITTLIAQFNNYKLQLGDTYLNQQTLLKKIEEVKSEYALVEKELMETYGADAVINVETGEVSEKPKEPKMKVKK
jgi:hypothetical protein